MDKEMQYWRRKVMSEPDNDYAVLILADLLKRSNDELVDVNYNNWTQDHEIAKMLVVSTGHITQEESEILENHPIGHITNISYGYLIWVPTDIEEGYYPHNLQTGSSNSFILPNVFNLIVYAQQLGCYWLRLDSDGPIEEYLPHFEW
jgi:hypothetical protein